MDVFIHNRFKSTVIKCKECGKDMIVRLNRLDDHGGICQKCWVVAWNTKNNNTQRVCRICGVNLTQENIVKRGKTTGLSRICAKCESERTRKIARQRKRDVIDHYGGRCACCGENKIEFLTIDHARNDGGKHRKSITDSNDYNKFAGERFYRWIVKNKYPDDLGLRVLCWNCNCSRGAFGYCPHENISNPN